MTGTVDSDCEGRSGPAIGTIQGNELAEFIPVKGKFQCPLPRGTFVPIDETGDGTVFPCTLSTAAAFGPAGLESVPTHGGSAATFAIAVPTYSSPFVVRSQAANN